MHGRRVVLDVGVDRARAAVGAHADGKSPALNRSRVKQIQNGDARIALDAPERALDAAVFDKSGAFIKSIQTYLEGAPDRLIAAFLHSKGHSAQTRSPQERVGVAMLLIHLAIVSCFWILLFSTLGGEKPPLNEVIGYILLSVFWPGVFLFGLLYWLFNKPLTRTFAKQVAESQARRDADLRAAAPVACKDAIGEMMRFRDSTAEQYAALQKKLDELKGTAAALADQRPQPPT